jgi:hypothetical protein
MQDVLTLLGLMSSWPFFPVFIMPLNRLRQQQRLAKG